MFFAIDDDPEAVFTGSERILGSLPFGIIKPASAGESMFHRGLTEFSSAKDRKKERAKTAAAD